ncbi:MAG: TIGR02206 family membrane protein [Lachnospiraceae bacterium]
MKDFFLFETELTADSGFDLFGPCHLIWLFCIALFTVATAGWYAGKEEAARKKICHLFGILFPVIALYRDIVLGVTGHFDNGFLPLHLCGMALWIATLYCWTRNRFLGVIYVLLCVPGAAGALLFPDWVAYPFFNYMHIHDFISHGLIVAFGFCLIRAEEMVPEWKEFWMPVVFGIVGFVVIHWINVRLGTNYWFLNYPPAGSPLVWLFHLTGERWYRLGYFIFCLGIVAIWQGILKFLQGKTRCAMLRL